jgi:hypothetical protein
LLTINNSVHSWKSHVWLWIIQFILSIIIYKIIEMVKIIPKHTMVKPVPLKKEPKHTISKFGLKGENNAKSRPRPTHPDEEQFQVQSQNWFRKTTFIKSDRKLRKSDMWVLTGARTKYRNRDEMKRVCFHVCFNIRIR